MKELKTKYVTIKLIDDRLYLLQLAHDGFDKSTKDQLIRLVNFLSFDFEPLSITGKHVNWRISTDIGTTVLNTLLNRLNFNLT